MPFQSEKQRRYLWANEPEIAREWTDRYGARGGGIMRVPFQEGGLESLPFRDYFKLPPFSEGSPYTWTFPTGEEGEGGEGKGQSGLLNYRPINMGGGDGQMGLEQTWSSLPGDPKNYRRDQLLGNADYFPPETKFQGIMEGAKNLFFPGKVRGTLGDRLYSQYQTGQKLPSWIAAIVGAQSGFNPKSKNYNKFWKEQLNYLEGLGDKNTMYIGRDGGSGHLRYGPDSVLSGQNVISGFGSNNYATQLAKKLAWFKARDKANKSFSEKKYQDTITEIAAWDNSPDNPKNKPTGPTYVPNTPQPPGGQQGHNEGMAESSPDPGGQQGHNEGMAESSPDPVSDAGGDDEWGDMGWSRGGRIGLNYGGIASLWRR